MHQDSCTHGLPPSHLQPQAFLDRTIGAGLSFKCFNVYGITSSQSVYHVSFKHYPHATVNSCPFSALATFGLLWCQWKKKTDWDANEDRGTGRWTVDTYTYTLHTTVMNTHTAASAVIECNKGKKMKLNDIYASRKVTFLIQMDLTE